MRSLPSKATCPVLGVILSALFVGGCAQLPVQFSYHPFDDGTASGHLVWPDPPEKPRYRYYGQLTGEENFVRTGEASLGVLERVFRWLVGLGDYGDEPVILQRPQSGVVTDDGRILVTDVSRQGIYVFDPSNRKLEVWEYAAEGIRFQLPIGIVAKDDSVLVADAGLGYVVRLNRLGKPLGVLGRNVLKHPTGIVWDAEGGRVYVTDRADNQIKVFDDDSGELLFVFGEFGEREGQLNGPTYLAWHDNELYVTDTLNSRIQIFSAQGEFLRGFGRRGLYVGDLPRPKGVALDSDGNIYVVESYYDYLLVFDRKGQFLLPIGGSGHEIGQFYLPAGVWSDAENRIYVADMFNGRVVIFEYLGDGDESDVAEDNSAHVGRAADSR